MIRYEEGGLEQNDNGACFPNRPYYPLLAGNGTDAILIGLGGFPDEPNWMCYSMPLPYRINLGWYKTARKDYSYAHKHYGPSTYGTSVALAGISTVLTIGNDYNIGIRNPKQFFDPIKRVLTTTFSLNESRGKTTAEIKVTSFMTDDHLLVEHYDVLREPDSGIRFGFVLDTPHSTDLHELCVHPESIQHQALPNGFGFNYRYRSPELYDGMAASWTDSPEAEYDNNTTEYSPVIKEGQSVTHYVSVVDSYDAEDYRGYIEQLQQKTVSKGYDSILSEHIKAGEKLHSASSVNLPEKDLEYLYNYSNYVLSATFDKSSGFMPMGILPCNWHNAMFWDCWFASMAWLGSNRADYSTKIASFYNSKLAEARTVAEKLNCPGARYAWTTNREHFELNPENVIQFHNNAVIALLCLQVYQFSGDNAFLEDIFDTVEQSLEFLTERLVEIKDGQAILKECAGLDESTHDLKGTDTWTASVYVKALNLYLDACKLLARKPFQDGLADVSDMLITAVDRNIDSDGVLQSFAGGIKPHWGSLIFHIYHDHLALKQTIDALSHYEEELDTYHSHGVAGYKGRVFTWTEYWIAAIMGMHNNSDGWTRLKKCAKLTDRFGSIPERVFYDGELLKRPFMTSHGSYIWAVNSLLMNRQGKQLTIMTNLPDSWTNVSFENLTTPDGLKVSAAMENGQITMLSITNTNANEHAISLALPNREDINISLNYNETYQL